MHENTGRMHENTSSMHDNTGSMHDNTGSMHDKRGADQGKDNWWIPGFLKSVPKEEDDEAFFEQLNARKWSTDRVVAFFEEMKLPQLDAIREKAVDGELL